jgi:hypothetical protein
VSKFLPYDTPIYLNFLNEMISKNLKHLDISEPVAEQEISHLQASSEGDSHSTAIKRDEYPSELEEEKVP